MSNSIGISKRWMVVLSLGCLGGFAQAQVSDPGSELERGRLVAHGAGSVHLPNFQQDGLLVGILVGDKDGARYTIEAQLTLFHTLQPVPNRIAVGGMYGKLLEVAQGGMLADASARFAGHVEGNWELSADLSGQYEAKVYARSEDGSLRLAGLVSGKFQVELQSASHSLHHSAPSLSAQRAKVGLSDRKSVLDDAAEKRAELLRLRAEAAKSKKSSLAMSIAQDFGSARSRLIGDALLAGQFSAVAILMQ